MRICPQHGYIFAFVCVCVSTMCVKEQKIKTETKHTHTEIERKVACASKQHCGLNTILSPFSILKVAALIGVLSITMYCIYIIYSLHICACLHVPSRFPFCCVNKYLTHHILFIRHQLHLSSGNNMVYISILASRLICILPFAAGDVTDLGG